jgi:regulator of replication initiation timing
MFKNEAENFEQGHDSGIVKKNVMPEIEANVRSLVDEMIDIELGNLRMKYKLKKPKKGKKKKKKKAKKAKKVPGARLCKNRDPRDMLAEVIKNFNLIKNFRKKYI